MVALGCGVERAEVVVQSGVVAAADVTVAAVPDSLRNFSTNALKGISVCCVRYHRGQVVSQ